MSSPLSHRFPSNRKRGSLWMTGVSVLRLLGKHILQTQPQVEHVGTHIFSHTNTSKINTLPLDIQSAEHTLITVHCICHHVYSINDRSRRFCTALDNCSSLQPPKPINQPRQSAQSLLPELNSDIKHLESSHQHVTLSLSEHHKANGNTDKILHVCVPYILQPPVYGTQCYRTH